MGAISKRRSPHHLDHLGIDDFLALLDGANTASTLFPQCSILTSTSSPPLPALIPPIPAPLPPATAEDSSIHNPSTFANAAFTFFPQSSILPSPSSPSLPAPIPTTPAPLPPPPPADLTTLISSPFANTSFTSFPQLPIIPTPSTPPFLAPIPPSHASLPPPTPGDFAVLHPSIPVKKPASRRFACSLCSKTFSRKDNLAVHARVHTGDRPYACPHCPRRFMWPSSSRAHAATHSRVMIDPVAPARAKQKKPVASAQRPIAPRHCASLDCPHESPPKPALEGMHDEIDQLHLDDFLDAGVSDGFYALPGAG